MKAVGHPAYPTARSGLATGPYVARYGSYVSLLVWNSEAVTAFTGAEADDAVTRVAHACMHVAPLDHHHWGAEADE